jgi:catalase
MAPVSIFRLAVLSLLIAVAAPRGLADAAPGAEPGAAPAAAPAAIPAAATPAAAAPGAQAPAAAPGAEAPTQTPLPIALVDALNKLSHGPHAGYRANHAKGIMVEGHFTPNKSAAEFSKAIHFRQTVPVLVRFSDPSGVPTIPDADPAASPHGIAIRFKLPGNANTDIVSLSANSFPVATPEDFLAFLRAAAASGPDAPKPTPFEQFLKTHPAAAKFATTIHRAPQSFATLAFYGINSFKFTNAAGVSHYARYQIQPMAGERALTDEQAKSADPNYLMDELPTRIAKGPVTFQIMAQVADKDDPINDPTIVWPNDREHIFLGTLTLTSMVKDQVKAQKSIMFSPLNLTAGIEPSEDPVLLARPAAYGVSFAQRSR